MEEDNCKISWNTYPEHVTEMLHDMIRYKELSDVTLICDDRKELKAHKIVLSACSKVFNSIFKEHSVDNSVIYLSGIKHQEMESILDFMYVGVASFEKDRMNDLVDMTQSLEVKEIGYFKDYFNVKKINTDENEVRQLKEELMNEINEDKFQNDNIDFGKSRRLSFKRNLVDVSNLQTEEGKFTCHQCQKEFSSDLGFRIHIQSKHQDLKYSCNECNFQAVTPSHLKGHIKSKLEGVKYACDLCKFQATQKYNLKTHIQTKHEGLRFTCKYCDHKATQLGNLRSHIKRKHGSENHI